MACAVVGCGQVGDAACPEKVPVTRTLTPVENGVPPNILIVVTDDQGLDLVGAYGDLIEAKDPPATPVVDELIADGIRFEQAWAAPTCAPSRAALMTGRYPRRSGFGSKPNDNNRAVLSLDEVMLPAAVPAAYDTAAIGKWHLSHILSKGGLDHPNIAGFDTFAGTIGNIGDTIGTEDPSGLPVSYQHWVRVENGKWAWEDGYATSVNVDDALDRIGEMEEPWLLYLAFNAPHAPHMPPPDHLNFRRVTENSSAPQMVRSSVEAMDAELGRLLDGIEAQRDHTFVIFLSDNGTAGFANAPPLPGKNTMTERGLRVPFAVTGPGVARGASTDALVSVVDILPTVVELTGGPTEWPAPLDGRSLVPLLADPLDTSAHDLLYTEKFIPPRATADATWHRDWRAIRNRRYKLVQLDGENHFYDLEGDADGVDLLAEPSLSKSAESALSCLTTNMDAVVEHMLDDLLDDAR